MPITFDKADPWALDTDHETELTIATGVISPIFANHAVDTEGDAATDDLDTITGAFDRAILLLRLAHPDRQVVLKHNTGNLLLPSAADVTLSPSKLYQGLWYSVTLAKWLGLESAYYILRDLFTDTRDAGAINSTPATPGPGTRTVVDTESKLTVADGAAVFAGGKASPEVGDPGIWYPAITRQAGRLLLFTYQGTTGRYIGNIGFDANQLPGNTLYDAIGRGTNHLYWSPALIGVNIGTWSTAEWQLAIVLRSTGQYLFLREATAAWQMAWPGSLGNTATLYPYISNYNDTTTIKNVRIPAVLWLPTPLAYTVFGGAAGDLNASQTDATGPDAQTTPQRTWVSNAGIWTLSGAGTVTGTPTLGAEQATGTLTIGKWYSITASQTNYFYTGSAIDDKFLATAATALDANNKVKEITLTDMFATVACSTADVMWDVKVASLTAKTQAGLVVRLDSTSAPTKCIICVLDGSGNVTVREQTAATTWTTLFTAVKAAAANDTLRLHLSGNAVRCYHITSGGTVTMIGSATATANTNVNHGVLNTSAGSNTIALVQGFAVGTGGEYAALEAM